MNDLISREQAIDAIYKESKLANSEVADEYAEMFVYALKTLPSEEPVIRCKDCKHYHTFANGMSVSWCDFGYSREIDISDWWYCADAKPKEGEEE